MIDFNERYSSLIKKFGNYPKVSVEMTTLEEMEWSMLMRPHCQFALPQLSEACDEIESLVAQGWINHGWFNNSPIASLLPDETGLRARFFQMKETNEEYKLIKFWYDDDDIRAFLLTPPPVGFY